MYKKLHIWINSYFYKPNFIQIALAFILYPLSLIYKFIIYAKFFLKKEIDFGIPIISMGNLIVGGSGKTPLCIAILNEFDGGFVILRGYKRKSKGLVKVCLSGEILTNISMSGDEAMEYAKSVQKANVIVSENRQNAILKAKKLGAKYILLDDGFSKFNIKKFNILIKAKDEPFFKFCLPSGAYRYPYDFYKFADFIAKEGFSHFRSSKILNKTEKMLLVSAIANPNRLDDFKKLCVGFEFYPDHYDFKEHELRNLIAKYKATSLLVTSKDLVKIENFNIPLSVIKLETSLSKEFKELIKSKIL